MLLGFKDELINRGKRKNIEECTSSDACHFICPISS
jgi:hypothetical protein